VVGTRALLDARAVLPAASRDRETPEEIPHSATQELPDLAAPVGIPDAAASVTDPGRGSNLGTAATASGSGTGRDDGAGRGARGVRGSGKRGSGACGGGGTAHENAIEAALKWLADHQKTDGGWSLTPSWERSGWRFPEWRVRSVKLKGSYADALGTSLALLAFSGAGYGEASGKYAKVVGNGLRWLRGWQEAQISGKCEPHSAAIIALALSEASYVAQREMTKRAAQKAVSTLCMHYRGGGWRRRWLVSGATWAALTIKAADKAGLEVNKHARTRLREVLLAGRRDNGGFAYKVVDKDSKLLTEGKGFASATAGGVAALLCLGTSPRNARLRRSADLALEKAEKARRDYRHGDFLMLHHGSVAMRLMGSDRRRSWRKAAIEPTLATQIRKGSDKGAWPTKATSYLWSGDRPNAGNVFATALGAMILESELGHSPLCR